ncbi:MAG: ATP-binding protein [Bacteroidota bacterium]
MSDKELREEELQKEIAFYKKQLDQLTGKALRFDILLTAMRHSVKQKSDVLAVLTTLQNTYTVTTAFDTLLSETIKAITTNLGMHRSVALLPNETNTYSVAHHYGYPSQVFSAKEPAAITIPPQYLKAGAFMLINKKTETDEATKHIQNKLAISFFVGLPLMYNDEPVAFIVTGRTVERPPFAPVLEKADVDSLTAIIGLVSAVLQNKKLVAVELAKTAVEDENEIIASQRDMLEKTLTDLKAAQAQLIQSEKMASLGELTAGIAHEIQNPLNFVNNFSDVSQELLAEMKEELNNGNVQDAKDIANDVIQNLEKINHHGKRADAIVKGMLQHSRTTTGQKELTDINALADEYLRLAYHGLRAKDKTFNATLETVYDDTIQKIEIIPQDIGRVLLNLITNAFYAISAKASTYNKSMVDKSAAADGYQPTVWVTTKKDGDAVVISVKDNGNGIPQNTIDKIFQPFFTTKPTGQGTGLGLSLAYDIVKAHGGELKVETKEGEGAEFSIQLLMKK